MVISRRRVLLHALMLALLGTGAVTPITAFAQDDVRPMPAPGVALPDTDRAELTAGVKALGDTITALRTELKSKPALLRYLPDVQIYYNAVNYPLLYNEFYDVKQAGVAKKLLAQGMERATALRAGTTPWTQQSGLLVLGYVSKIDGSVQPYGLVVPTTWVAGETKKHRLDFFLHGRDERLTELSFIDQSQNGAGEFTPPDAFVLRPYGRYCNANRFAGEVDAFEALADAKQRYPVDSDRIVMRGFSMGGASCWQYATHHSDLWAAAAPGAGFSETAEFLNLNAPGKSPRPWYEQRLWHWYDSIDYAANLYQCPTVAYNGDKDGQKQAADRMQDAMAKEGLTLTRVIGPDTGHWYHKDSKKEINDKVDVFVAKGGDTLPSAIHFTTWTLRYNTMNWLTVTGVAQHWTRARVDAERTGDGITVKTQNVTRFSLAPAVVAQKPVTIDGQKLTGSQFVKVKGSWTADKGVDSKQLRKVPGLQGPIDDAFMDHFIMVRPTGTPASPQIGEWVNSEMPRAIREWRAMFRGDALVKDDKAVTDVDMAAGNLVLWGDPSSNSVLARIAPKLPIRWDKDGTVHLAGQTYPRGTTVPILIYPNPLNPKHYVVLNSGITWREGQYYNNAEQYAHLPDWTIVDITTPPNKYAPGRIRDAGFFDESWQIKAFEETSAPTP